MSVPWDEKFLNKGCDTGKPIDLSPPGINESPLPDPENWSWPGEDRTVWKEVGGRLQKFYEYWRSRGYGSDLKKEFPYPLLLGGPEVELPIHPAHTIDNKIVVTKEYHDMYFRILRLRQAYGPRGGVVLTGQPGIGASI